MNVGTYKRIATIFAILAIAVIFSTVAPVRSSAFEGEFISNVVISSENTGGKSSQGQDGEDGEDGKDGEAGKSGANGSSVINIGGNNAYTRIESSVDGETKVLEINQNGNTSSKVETYASSSTQEGANGSLVSTSSVVLNEEIHLSLLERALNSMQVMIATYVSFLF